MLLTRLKRLLVLTVAVVTLSVFVGVSATAASPADGSTGRSQTVQQRAPARAAIIAPFCVDRWSHTHLFNKDVHLWNRCGYTLWVKVIVAYGPDSDCKRLEPEATATHSWSYGWPYAWSRFDRLDLC